MLAAGAQPLQVSRHGRWSDGSRSFAGYVEEATGFGDANPTKGLLLCMPCTFYRLTSDSVRLSQVSDVVASWGRRAVADRIRDR